jgi:galactokinase
VKTPDAIAPLPAAREAREFFKRTFGFPPTHVATAPGRLELVGNHTDYNQGLVLAFAVDRATSMAIASRPDGRIELASSAVPGRVSFALDAIVPDPAMPWANYVKGVIRELQRRGVHFTGFSAAVHSTIPMGAGLSSSAALEVATALAVRALHPYSLSQSGCTAPPRRGSDGTLPPLTTLEKLETAKLCRTAENQFVGVQCGILDQISSLFGRAHHALEIDCQSLAVDAVPMAGEIALVICPSGVRHELVAGEYNELRLHCEAAAAALGVKSLRSVDLKILAANKSRLTPRQHDCALHIVGENQRVVFGARALRDGDFPQFGQYLFQSHESSRDRFRNSCAELDLLVELARGHPACHGARLTGGGFGGATLNLVERAGVESFKQSMAERYERAIAIPMEPMVCQAAAGAC